jgi:glutaredoxin 3
MTKITIYTQSNCRQSDKAKQLILSRNLNFVERDISYDVLMKREMIERTGGKATTPQVFINSKHIGGFEQLTKTLTSKSA